jgi:hypothetical protein
VSRKAWRHSDLRDDLVAGAKLAGWDPFEVVWGAAHIDYWRAGDLKALGIDPADYCVETWGAESVKLPARPLDERGQSVRVDEDAA